MDNESFLDDFNQLVRLYSVVLIISDTFITFFLLIQEWRPCLCQIQLNNSLYNLLEDLLFVSFFGMKKKNMMMEFIVLFVVSSMTNKNMIVLLILNAGRNCFISNKSVPHLTVDCFTSSFFKKEIFSKNHDFSLSISKYFWICFISHSWSIHWLLIPLYCISIHSHPSLFVSIVRESVTLWLFDFWSLFSPLLYFYSPIP